MEQGRGKWRADLEFLLFCQFNNTLHKGGISTPTSTSPHSIPQALPQAKELCQSLVKLSALLIASRTDLFTYNSLCSQISAQVTSSKDDYITIEAGSKIPNLFISTKILLGNVISLGIRLPYAIPIFAVHTPAMLIGWSLSKKYASHEEESMASAKSIWWVLTIKRGRQSLLNLTADYFFPLHLLIVASW